MSGNVKTTENGTFFERDMELNFLLQSDILQMRLREFTRSQEVDIMKTAEMFGLCMIDIIKKSFLLQKDLLAVLVIFVLVDYLTEMVLMIFKKKIIFGAYIEGTVRKCFVFIIVLLAGIIDIYILKNGAVISAATMLFYLSYEGVAILKNVSKIGVPFPRILKNTLEQMKDGKK